MPRSRRQKRFRRIGLWRIEPKVRLKYSAVAGVADGTSGYRMDHSLPSGLDAMATYSHTGSEDKEAGLMKRPCLDRRPNWSKDEDNWTKRPCVDRLWV